MSIEFDEENEYGENYDGAFTIDKPVDEDTYNLLRGLGTTRRMKRNIQGFGDEGEFYVDGYGFKGIERESTIVSYNEPPATQPSLWCQWLIDEDHQTISWDGGEKFHYPAEWISYIIEKILAPRGYTVNGEVQFIDCYDGGGTIMVRDNVVTS